ncbi:acyltransferase family protein [Mesorhizobium tianshanense]|uniref:Peptidoglycan/LPS O-acetylase OafA/YrhL n=1 Tax=Mesorhizobium tianshanense TaxID=39844 RepID=A0A562PBX3_9HYPH|nr:acyltransferase [Mesorhizobium tianshanense]TWI41937.1 peptidoglycan/LPS O-acetylase OafA/YrhL [Mesorhizobium tianshanense]
MAALGDEGGRRAQIDGLRVLAMVGVLYVHYWNERPTLEFVRVSLFFVVSGFLISHILLSSKDSLSKISIINFYIRRSLRLLPSLFLVLLIAVLFNMDGIRSSVKWHVLQGSNLYFMNTEGWKPWIVAHLWSLNVVEQFYILSPIIIMFFSRRSIFLIYAGVFALSIVLRVHCVDLGISPWAKIVLFVFDPLAAGAILALVKENRDVQAVLTSRLSNLVSIAIIFSPFVVGHNFGQSESYRILSIYALSSVVLSAYVGYGGVVALVLANPVARFLSRVSYSTYIYHMAIWWLIAENWPTLYHKGPITFFAMSTSTIIVATLSWHLVEKHFDALKVFFPVAKTLHNPAGDTVSDRPRNLPVKSQTASPKDGSISYARSGW